ncbi:MAG: molybdenum cofactor guanylyltransferase [Candidatus Hodarchaeota archaeon]
MLKIKKKSKFLAIAILIGGKSSRFGSDKGLFEITGKPLISYQLEILSTLDFDIFLIAKSIEQVNNYMKKIDITKINAFIVDEMNNNQNNVLYTPMIGLYSTFKELKKLNYKKVLALSCDTPLIKKNILEYLIEQCSNVDCCIPQWANGFSEPLIAVYPVKKALKTARKSIREKTYKLTNLLNPKWRISFISIEENLKQIDENLSSFINLNEPSDLEKIKPFFKDSNI